MTCLPKLGMGTTEVEILEWYVEIGEFGPVGAALVEVETEKLTTIIEADAAGVLVRVLLRRRRHRRRSAR